MIVLYLLGVLRYGNGNNSAIVMPFPVFKLHMDCLPLSSFVQAASNPLRMSRCQDILEGFRFPPLYLISSDNVLWGWGSNGVGQLGDGTNENRLYPLKIMKGVIVVSAGNGYTMAITSDNVLWGWGNNDVGQLGDGTNENRLYPVKIMEGVISVAAGGNYTFAIDHDNSMWAWGGSNPRHYTHIFGFVFIQPESSLFGDNRHNDRNTPTRIMSNVVSVSAGLNLLYTDYVFIVTANEVLWAWGDIWGCWQVDSDYYDEYGNWVYWIIQMQRVRPNDDFIPPIVPVKIMDGILLPN